MCLSLINNDMDPILCESSGFSKIDSKQEHIHLHSVFVRAQVCIQFVSVFLLIYLLVHTW